MASVEVSMLPKNSQPFTETVKVWDPLPLKPSKSRFRLPGVKDLVIGIALLSCITTLCVLYAKILALEQRISLSQATSSSVVMDATSATDDGIPHVVPTNSGEEKSDIVLVNSKNRRRRDASGTSGAQIGTGGAQSGTGWNAASYVSNLEVPHDHTFIHVTGTLSSVVSRGDWFTWHSDEEASYQNIATSLVPFVHSKFVQIIQPGYYYVYSQVTFSDLNNFAIGHEIVRKPNCGNGAEQRLLNSIRYQIPTTYPNGEAFYPEDSGYIGGVFYLSANDRVGVRPLSGHGPQARRFIANQPTGSYFGMFMLSSDPSSRVAEWDDCI